MKSVVNMLNTEEFPRIRIGTGFCDDKSNLIEYVIRKLSNNEYTKLQRGINLATEAVIEIMKNGMDQAMNKMN